MVYYASLTPSFPLAREQLALVDEYQEDRPPTGATSGATSRVSGKRTMGRAPSGTTDPRTVRRDELSSHPTPVSPTDSVVVSPADSGAVSPLDDVEALEALEERITTLAARIHAATHRLLVLIADFDRRQGWKLGGHRSCAHWLALRTGIDLGTAREKVRTARVLVGLPETSASMSRGELSFSQVRAVTRVATPENEKKLLKEAHNSTTAQLERKVRAFKLGSREDEAALERRRFESRSLSVFSDHEGMYVVRGRLTAEVGALLMRAIEAASDVLYREGRASEMDSVVGTDMNTMTDPETSTETGPDMGSGSRSNPASKTASNPATKTESDVESQKAAAQRRADALGLLVEQALAAGFGGDGGKIETRAGGGVANGSRAGCGKARGGVAMGQTGGEAETRTPAPVSGTRAERYQVMLHVDEETLRSDGEGGRSELEDGTRLSAETSQRLSCDAGLVRVHHARDGSILDAGRRTRTIPPALRRALEVRDGGCRFPGCGSRFTEGHHVKHWADGGETSKDNCLLVCRHHHRLLHEGGWRVEWRNGKDPGDRPGMRGGSGGGEARGASGGKGKGGRNGARRYPVFIDPRGGLHPDGGG